jgi:hypothetical protein
VHLLRAPPQLPAPQQLPSTVSGVEVTVARIVATTAGIVATTAADLGLIFEEP